MRSDLHTKNKLVHHSIDVFCSLLLCEASFFLSPFVSPADVLRVSHHYFLTAIASSFPSPCRCTKESWTWVSLNVEVNLGVDDPMASRFDAAMGFRSGVVVCLDCLDCDAWFPDTMRTLRRHHFVQCLWCCVAQST